MIAATGEKQEVTLPSDIQTKADIKVVEYWGMAASPPSSKIRALLKYHNIQYIKNDGFKKGDPYQKVPVLRVNGTQINDSFIMVKALAPVLHGRPLTDEEVKFEEEMCYGLMLVLELYMFNNGSNWQAQLRKQLPCCIACCLGTCTCNMICYRRSGYNKTKKLYGTEESHMAKYIAMIEERLSKHEFLSGNEIGMLDVSLYGTTSAFSRPPIMPSFQTEFLDRSPLISQWWLKMF